MSIKLDKIDKHILQVLQRDGKIQNIELAKEVGLSPSPVYVVYVYLKSQV